MALITESTWFARAAAAVRAGTEDPRSATAAMVGALSDSELLWLLDGDTPMVRGMAQMLKYYNRKPYVAGRLDRLGIPGIRFVDGPRGVVSGSATAFPVSTARAATFDVDLERRVGDAIGKEVRAAGGNLFGGVCVNVPPFPGWGRSQESYGDDSFLNGQMGAALTRGVAPWAIATVKHFAVNSMEEARFSVDVDVDEATLQEAYLPHFRAAIDAGAKCVMSAYNSVNGEWAGQNAHLLNDVLRDQWGFDGFVMTDFMWGLRDPVGSVAAGQDLEMPLRMQRARTLPAALRRGTLRRSDAEQAARRLLTTQLRLAAHAHPEPAATVTASAQHRALAREAAARAAVLLVNRVVAERATLPLHEQQVKGVAVLGRLAEEANLGDFGSSRVRPPTSVSVAEGLRERLGPRVLANPSDDAVRAADAVVVVVGMGAQDEGEFIAASDPDALALFGAPMRWTWGPEAQQTPLGRVG